MDHAEHAHRHITHGHARPAAREAEMAAPASRVPRPNLTRVAFVATVHCLAGCAIGEILGMVIGTAFGLDNLTTTAIAVVLAFGFGYLLTMLPLLQSGMPRTTALKLALSADTASITLMEIIDNALMWLIPGAMDAALDTTLFWASLTVSLIVAGLAAWPLNRWLIARGEGHAVVHASHGH